MFSPEQIAERISWIVGNRLYVHDHWAALEVAEQQRLISLWSALIRDDADTAAERIHDSLLAHSSLGDGWRKLHDTPGMPTRQAGIVHLVSDQLESK